MKYLKLENGGWLNLDSICSLGKWSKDDNDYIAYTADGRMVDLTFKDRQKIEAWMGIQTE